MRTALIVSFLLAAVVAIAADEPTPVDGPYDVTFTMPASGAVQVLLDWQNGAGLSLNCSTKGATLTLVSKQGKQPLAASTGSMAGTVRLRRRQPLVELEAGGRIVLRTYCDRAIAGSVLLLPGTKGPELHIQPVEPASFHDDFFDPEGGESLWEPLSGQWSIGTYRDPLKALENRPIAASWYQAKADGVAVTLTGQGFWEHYRVRTAVLAAAGMRAGLVFYYQDKENYCVFSVRPGADGQGLAELTIVQQGQAKTTPLSTPVPWRIGNWHELAVQVDDTHARCSVGGTTVLQPSVPGAGGRVGLLADGNGEARFDDFDVRPAQWWQQEAFGTRLTDWSGTGGAWGMDCGYLQGKARAFSPCLWRRPENANTIRVTLRPGKGTSGVLLNWRNNSGYRLSLGPSGVALERVTDGKAVTLATAPGKAREGMVKLSHRAGRLTARTALGQLSALDFTYSGSACGVFTDGEARFSSAEATGGEEAPTVISTVTGARTPMPGENSDTARFVLGYLWTPSGGTWGGVGAEQRLSGRPYGQSAPAALWYYKPCPGDADLTLENLKLNPGASGGVAISCDNKGYHLGSGYRAETDGKTLKLFRADKLVAEKTLAKAPSSLRLWRDGRYLVATADGLPLAYEDAQPLPGSLCAVYATGAGVTMGQATLANRRATYYAFKSEETDWQPALGEWSTHTGMACIAWDYWYTARPAAGSPQALSWHIKPRLNLQHLDGWVAEYTEGYANGHHEHFPYHDVSVVLNAAGSGTNPPTLDGGYRFLIGGEKGPVTRLLRLGQVVAETRDPAFAVRMESHCNNPRDLHFIVHRDGARLTLQLNDRMALDWTDPQPLGPGQLGIGTTGCSALFRDVWMVRD